VCRAAIMSFDTRGAPALPPRLSETTTAQIGNYAAWNSSVYAMPDDPRRSSTQSLNPTKRQALEKRTLLLIYIHGSVLYDIRSNSFLISNRFMGAETSFRSFPAHVHNLVTITLAESHAVHTKIYPRYAARRSIDQVAEDFSRWFVPICQLRQPVN
jgi:hypothetical protein